MTANATASGSISRIARPAGAVTTISYRGSVTGAESLDGVDPAHHVAFPIGAVGLDVEFSLEPEAQEAWERINRRPARSLAGLRELMARPSPFIDE